MANALMMPGRTYLGNAALAAAEKELAALGKKALVVTGNTVKKGEAFSSLCAALDKIGMAHAVFSEIPGEPDDKMIQAGATAFRNEKCDCIIGIGGGSPLDSAKAIALVAAYEGNVCRLAGRNIEGKFPPFALIPTTAGTGSEATRFTVITDSEKGAKLLLRGDALLPDLAVIDPAFSRSAPPKLTAYTGMDALTHAVEAYTSKKANPMTDIFAVDAVKRILKSLPAAFLNGADEKAREDMAIAAYEAGVCISNASVTLVHGMSRPIGAKFHVPHGLSNAMLLVPCLAFAAAGAAERFASLADAVGIQGGAQGLILALTDIASVLQIPTLGAYGIAREAFFAQIPQMAQEALESGSPANTLRDVTLSDIIALYKKAFSDQTNILRVTTA